MRFVFFLLYFIFFSLLYADDYEIGIKNTVYFDKSRERPIIAEVFYPSKQHFHDHDPSSNNFKCLKELHNAYILNGNKKFPLIIISHRCQGDRFDHSWLQKSLAMQGYIVASLDHFGNTSYLQKPNSIKFDDRPQDISYLINALIEESKYKGLIDENKIGFVGFSLGGATGIGLAGGTTTPWIAKDRDQHEKLDVKKVLSSAKSYRDKRIKAALLMEPSHEPAFSKEGLSKIKIPILIIARHPNQEVNFFSENIMSSGLKILSKGTPFDVFIDYSKTPEEKNPRLENQKEISFMAIKFFDKYLKGI